MVSTSPVSTIRDIYTVTRLNREVRAVLEDSFPPVWVKGELSNLARPSSGHMYFSLKDRSSQVRCAMFKNRNLTLKFRPENGMSVILRANIGLYEGRGEYQLVVETMEPEGIGALQLAFEQLKEKLASEGLFDDQHKQTIPRFPAVIGVMTSPTGAAIRDILNVLNRRFPLARIIIYPVAVQGKEAAGQIEQAFKTVNRRNECDVLILARGGGSLEDLWPFNEERVARAVFESEIPVVCGIGHEIDFTITDFVADRRAPTPSAAAELVSPDTGKLAEAVSAMIVRMHSLTGREISHARLRMGSLERRLPHPLRRIQSFSQRLDELHIRIQRSTRSALGMKRTSVIKLKAEINQFSPLNRLSFYREKCANLGNRLESAIKQGLRNRQERLNGTRNTLHSVSPLATLERGYAIVTDLDSGNIIRDVETINAGVETKTEIKNGYLYAKVTRVEKK